MTKNTLQQNRLNKYLLYLLFGKMASLAFVLVKDICVGVFGI